MILYRYPTIVAIIVIAALVFAYEQTTGPLFLLHYGTVPQEINQAWDSLSGGTWSLAVVGELLTTVTALFLHGGPEHLIYNMVFLWIFGTLIAQHLGNWVALVLFLVCGVVGNIVQVCLNPNSPIPIVGASGAVYGFEGAYLGLALRWQLPNPDVWPLAHPIPPLQLGALAVVGLVFDGISIIETEQPIAYGAHLGGVAAGFAAALLLTQIFATASDYDRLRRR